MTTNESHNYNVTETIIIAAVAAMTLQLAKPILLIHVPPQSSHHMVHQIRPLH